MFKTAHFYLISGFEKVIIDITITYADLADNFQVLMINYQQKCRLVIEI